MSVEQQQNQLPLSLIKKIAKFDPDVQLISSEAVAALTFATECFIKAMSKEVYRFTAASKKKTMLMSHIGMLRDWPEKEKRPKETAAKAADESVGQENEEMNDVVAVAAEAEMASSESRSNL